MITRVSADLDAWPPRCPCREALLEFGKVSTAARTPAGIFGVGVGFRGGMPGRPARAPSVVTAWPLPGAWGWRRLGGPALSLASGGVLAGAGQGVGVAGRGCCGH